MMSVPGDQDVEEEAKTVQTCLEKLREENALVLKDVSKVMPDVPRRRRPLSRGPFDKEATARGLQAPPASSSPQGSHSLAATSSVNESHPSLFAPREPKDRR